MSKYSITLYGDSLAALATAAAVFANEATGAAPEVAPATPDKPPRKRAAPDAAPTAPAAPAAPKGATVEKPALMKVLTALCNMPDGRKLCGDLLEKHGAADRKIGSLPESAFKAAFDEATDLVEAGAQESPLG